jgi:EmrB/QacA subfamily drug resistance transporter
MSVPPPNPSALSKASNDVHARWVLIGSILGSGAAFLETSVVNVALPAIGRDLHLGVAGLETVANGYALTLSALMLLGGALGDRYQRSRVFAAGLVGFAVACAGCALAPSALVLVGWRIVQGVCGALLVPNSLAMLETAFTGEARGAAIGQWSAWSAVSTAVGPLFGGWMVDRASWRSVFAMMIPFALGAAWIAIRHGGASESPTHKRSKGDSVDYGGAALVTVAFAGIVGALTLATRQRLTDPLALALGIVALLAFAAFIMLERHLAEPLVPLGIFRSRLFTGTNVVTLIVYAALGGLLFLLMLELQDVMGYSALAAGAALLPVNVLLVAISPAAGRLAHRIGPRLPLTAASLLTASGIALFARLHAGAGFVESVLPAVLVFGVGLSMLVAPVTAAALGSLGDQSAGLASGINNTVARLGGLLATAALPLAAGMHASTLTDTSAFAASFARAMWIDAGVCATGGVVAWVLLGNGRRSG